MLCDLSVEEFAALANSMTAQCSRGAPPHDQVTSDVVYGHVVSLILHALLCSGDGGGLYARGAV